MTKILKVGVQQLGQIGRFFKFLATIFLKKVAQMYCDFLGSFKKQIL